MLCNKNFGNLILSSALFINVNGRLRMGKRVILVTGTPCVGKTFVARSLTSELDAFYVNLTELAVQENLISGKDEERGSMIVDENRMRHKIERLIEGSEKEDVVIDGYYAVNVVPKSLVAYDFVLRRNPVELRKFMEQCGFSGRKLWENLASEILDVCLVDALRVLDQEKVCELDITGKSVEETVDKILSVLSGHEKCYVGKVDWLGKLESEGLLDEYLKI
jgi:adenylate kinase